MLWTFALVILSIQQQGVTAAAQCLLVSQLLNRPQVLGPSVPKVASVIALRSRVSGTSAYR
jgi:hypothetical protein